MEHWGWSKNWMCQWVPNGAQNAGSGNGGSVTKGVNTIGFKEATFMLVPDKSHLTNIAPRSNAELPAPAKLET